MTREKMIQNMHTQWCYDCDTAKSIAAQLQADGETIARLEAALDAGLKAAHDSFEQHRRQASEIARLETERAKEWGLKRDLEGSLLVARAISETLTVERDAAISALAEEGRKRGEAEGRIAEIEAASRDAVLLLQDASSGFVHEGTSDMIWRAKRDQVVADLRRARAVLRPADGDAT